MGNLCKLCKVCDGRACRNTIPGPGAKGTGDVAIRNFDKWRDIRVNMDTLVEKKQISTDFELFGRSFSAPIFAGPIGAVKMHYSDEYDDRSFNKVLIKACNEAGIAAFTGDGMDDDQMVSGCEAVKEAEGRGIPTIKPWNLEMIKKKIELTKEANAFAVAMDIDAAGLPFLKNFTPPAGSKSVEQLREIVELLDVPFIVKGIMTPKAALKAKEAGASAIVVSNHGGRVLDQCPATAEVLEDIVKAVDGSMKIFVDGGIRTGVDVFKALALGADAVIIARPFVSSVYVGAGEAVKELAEKLKHELEDTMAMCGACSLEEISSDMVSVFK
ncbi:MAG: alpha-hydroxy-acid oxidizing protein [[Eubacterium] sulci]|jgi:L-lactate dehydrogenase (FMN-dependent) and related alpha-hydroxy acid dehydrogenases|nr:alpha-hydroxy-acid oxidizing protein [[Eubacterium] sulci]